jgi:hypothetical protein
MANIDKPISFVELEIDKGASKDKGLFLYFDQELNTLRITLNEKGDLGVYNLSYVSISSIRVKDVNKDTTRAFGSSNNSQILAKDLLCEVIECLKNENRLNASNFVSTGSYTDIPERYKKSTIGVKNEVITYTNQNSYVPPINKPTFLSVAPLYQAYVPPHKKMKLLVRSTELPTAKELYAMCKKAISVEDGLYKLKVKPLSEEDTQKDTEVQKSYNEYGMYIGDDVDDYGMYNAYNSNRGFMV